jgi:membrane protein DedA with SNARE-associated domain
MQPPEFTHSTTLRRNFWAAGIVAAFVGALLGFIYGRAVKRQSMPRACNTALPLQRYCIARLVGSEPSFRSLSRDR